jgi:hypothetical protein
VSSIAVRPGNASTQRHAVSKAFRQQAHWLAYLMTQNAVPPVSTQIDALGIRSGAEDACTLVLDVREFVSDAVSNSDIYDRLRSEVIYYFAAREQRVHLATVAGCRVISGDMTSLEARGRCACRRALRHPGALMADAGGPAFAMRNGPLMAQASLIDEPRPQRRYRDSGGVRCAVTPR